jgi:hypothetical protein
MTDFKTLAKRTLQDIQHGRHREAYALFTVGIVLVVLELIGIASVQILLSVILLALTFLVFHTSAAAGYGGDRRRPVTGMPCAAAAAP